MKGERIVNYNEKIEWEKCQKCGFLQYSTHIRCLNCKYEKFNSIKAIGNAKLLTYTILEAPPAEFRDITHYALGVLEFENGVKVLGQIDPNGQLKIGMKMKPMYKKICNNLDGKEVHDFIFEPI
ncbi:MAG: OB-fold domain-containing protein [Candidatus Lokiarchaeota archaeon]|nr:OB-fold domain-containing protein [Candidatus Lokiarchaeota archaeon]